MGRKSMTPDIETIVIGAGVVGLAAAANLATRGHEVMVLEQHGLIGSETSSRNSEVIHAGIYYPTGSLRARLCVRGKDLLYRFCADNGVAHDRVSKLLVATHADQLPKLAALQATAIANGVTDLQPLTAQEARKLEPELACVAALLSPSTGSIDSHGLMTALEGHITTRGGQVVLQSPVTALARTADGLYAVSLGDTGVVTCRNLVVSAGLHVSKLARTLQFDGRYAVPETYYAKGQYYALSGRSPFGRHIYPMPDGAWLGLHATIDLGGRCKFGPDIEWTPEIDYSFQPEKIETFLDFIRSYYPGLDPQRLHADYTGVRPKLYRAGEPVPDFRIDGPSAHGLTGLVILAGIESPGLTSCLAIGDYVGALLSNAPAN
jgi:L-2-hydroxyglutarate oxidase LhgO